MPEYLEFVIYKDGTMVGGMIERNCACSAEAAKRQISAFLKPLTENKSSPSS